MWQIVTVTIFSYSPHHKWVLTDRLQNYKMWIIVHVMDTYKRCGQARFINFIDSNLCNSIVCFGLNFMGNQQPLDDDSTVQQKIMRLEVLLRSIHIDIDLYALKHLNISNQINFTTRRLDKQFTPYLSVYIKTIRKQLRSENTKNSLPFRFMRRANCGLYISTKSYVFNGMLFEMRSHNN